MKKLVWKHQRYRIPFLESQMGSKDPMETNSEIWEMKSTHVQVATVEKHFSRALAFMKGCSSVSSKQKNKRVFLQGLFLAPLVSPAHRCSKAVFLENWIVSFKYTASSFLLINKRAEKIWHNLKHFFDSIVITLVTGVAVNIQNNCFSNSCIPHMNHWALCPYPERKAKD